MSAPLHTTPNASLPKLEVDNPSDALCAPGTPTVQAAPLLDPTTLLPSGTERRFYAWLPEEALEVVGFGTAWEATASGENRFCDIARQTEAFLHPWRSQGETIKPWHRLWGGFSFDSDLRDEAWHGFPAARWFLPAFQYIRQANQAWYVRAGFTRFSPESPNHKVPPTHSEAFPPVLQAHGDADAEAQWGRTVSRALTDIASAAGPQKIVLARQKKLASDKRIAIPDVLAELRSRQNVGALLAFEGAADHWFITSTPERLVTLRGRRIETHAVAGTAGAVNEQAENEARQKALLTSDKDRREHEWVVQSLAHSLGGLCRHFRRSPEPMVLSLPTVHHLLTHVEAQALPGTSLFDLAAAIHPTAAVGGFPQKQAQAWLRRHEGFERGWYAAPVGYVDADGDGSLYVAIRSGLLTPYTTTLFAGAGLVTGSDASAEWRETEDKIRTLFDVLEGKH